ncbi:MAG: helix-turn-helix domain-containing protein [Maricaulaceae bacterium]
MPVEITELHIAIAKAKGFQVHNTYDEPEAAQILGISHSTLMRLRHGGAIGFIQKSERRIAYFGFHLIDYLLAQQLCPDTKPPKDTKLESTGSLNKAVVLRGAVHGIANVPSKHDELRSAQQILMTPRMS